MRLADAADQNMTQYINNSASRYSHGTDHAQCHCECVLSYFTTNDGKKIGDVPNMCHVLVLILGQGAVRYPGEPPEF